MWINKQTGESVDLKEAIHQRYQEVFSEDEAVETCLNNEYYSPVEVGGYYFEVGDIFHNCMTEEEWLHVKTDLMETKVEDDIFEADHTEWEEGDSPNLVTLIKLDDNIVWRVE